MPHLQKTVLTFAVDKVSNMKSIDDQDISAMWTMFAKCKDGLENGRRLENMSWRLWYRSVNSGYSYSKGSDLTKQMATAAEPAHQQVAAFQKSKVTSNSWTKEGVIAPEVWREEMRPIVKVPASPAAVQSTTTVSPSSVSKILNAVETNALLPVSPSQKTIVPSPHRTHAATNAANSPLLKRTARIFAINTLDKRAEQTNTTAPLASPAGLSRPKSMFFVSDESDISDSDDESPAPSANTTTHMELFAPEPIQPIPQQRAYRLPYFDDNTEDDDDNAEYAHHRRARHRHVDEGFDADSDESDFEIKSSYSCASTFDEGICFSTRKQDNNDAFPPLFKKIQPTSEQCSPIQLSRSSALSAQIRSRTANRDAGADVDPRRKEWTESVRSGVVWDRKMPLGARTDRHAVAKDHTNTTGNVHLYW
ncbi:hypothetical protein BJ742DRAFT_783273 [Cladochytrium replicatum]|nr:hypothetical protein BJ742DRAFT_783273 [Cladochytrium replicatum]